MNPGPLVYQCITNTLVGFDLGHLVVSYQVGFLKFIKFLYTHSQFKDSDFFAIPCQQLSQHFWKLKSLVLMYDFAFQIIFDLSIVKNKF